MHALRRFAFTRFRTSPKTSTGRPLTGSPRQPSASAIGRCSGLAPLVFGGGFPPSGSPKGLVMVSWLHLSVLRPCRAHCSRALLGPRLRLSPNRGSVGLRRSGGSPLGASTPRGMHDQDSGGAYRRPCPRPPPRRSRRTPTPSIGTSAWPPMLYAIGERQFSSKRRSALVLELVPAGEFCCLAPQLK
jgi:hypothetical protein